MQNSKLSLSRQITIPGMYPHFLEDVNWNKPDKGRQILH